DRLQGVGRTVCLQCPYLHLSETLSAELCFTTERLLCNEGVRTCGTCMDLVINKVVQFQVMHVSDRNRAVEVLTCTSVSQAYFTVSGNRHAFPQLSVLPVVIKILHYFRKKLLFMLFFKLFPGKIYIIVRQVKRIHNVIFICSVEYRSCHVKSKCFCRKTQVNLKYLSDVHTGRHTKRVQHDIKRTSVWKERHILYREHTGNDTLVSVTSGHFISYRDLSLLGNVNAHCLVYTRRKFVSVFSCEYFGIYDNTIFTMRYFQRSISDFAGFLTEDRS